MLLNRAYFRLKPLLPRRLTMALRRWQARRKLGRVSDKWPIDPGAGVTPAGWPGWPEGKRFALVLTHDVEGEAGLKQCNAVAEVEERFHFRSAFNFIPEGKYSMSASVRESLGARGFEIGLHDLRHDGRLYESRFAFEEHAHAINSYLQAWGAQGFRSAFMLRELRWLHNLHILYDS